GVAWGRPAERQGHGGGTARARRSDHRRGGREPHRHGRQHRLFRHRHALSFAARRRRGVRHSSPEPARWRKRPEAGRIRRRHNRRCRRPDPQGLMVTAADTTATADAPADGASLRDSERVEVRRRWIMVTPALVILMFAALGPLAIMVIYSFLTPASYGGV